MSCLSVCWIFTGNDWTRKAVVSRMDGMPFDIPLFLFRQYVSPRPRGRFLVFWNCLACLLASWMMGGSTKRKIVDSGTEFRYTSRAACASIPFDFLTTTVRASLESVLCCSMSMRWVGKYIPLGFRLLDLQIIASTLTLFFFEISVVFILPLPRLTRFQSIVVLPSDDQLSSVPQRKEEQGRTRIF